MIELFHLVKQDTELGATPSDSGKTNAINLQVLNMLEGLCSCTLCGQIGDDLSFGLPD